MMARDELCKLLPPEASVTVKNELMWNGERIAYFVPIITSMVEADREGYTNTFYRLICLFANAAESQTFDLRSDELEKICWPDLDPRCLLDPDYPAAKGHLAHIVRYMRINAPTLKEFHITRTGFHEIEGVQFYSLGDRVLWSPDTEDKLNVVLEPQTHHMAVDIGRYSEWDAFGGIAELISLMPDAGRVIVAHVITGLTRAAYIAAGITPNAALDVVGPSGSLKSTSVPLLAQIYNRDEEIKPETRLNSSHRYIEELLHDNCDFTTIIDDLHTAESRAIKRKNEEAKEEITRRIGDDTGRGRMAGNKAVQQNPRGNAIFLGEYLTGVQSTVARGLVVYLTKPDSRRLAKFQREPLLISTFYYYFLAWFIENFDDIRDGLAELLGEHRDSDLGDIHLRLQTTKFCLFTGYMLFWKYALDKGIVKDSVAHAETQDFWSLLTELVKAQNGRVNKDPESTATGVDYFELIRGWYRDGAFRLASDAEHLRGQDGFQHKDLLCLRGDRLMKKIHKIMPAATTNEVRQSLLAHKALWLDGERKNKRVCNQRVIGIPLKKLK